MDGSFNQMVKNLSTSLEKTAADAESFLASLGIDKANFKEITELDFSDQKSLNNIDFLSFFPKLKVLDLSSCNNLENISGVVNLPDLEELDLSWCESLQSISDLSKCTQLSSLNLICTSQYLNSDAYDLLALVVLGDEEVVAKYEWDAEEDVDPHLRLEGETITAWSVDNSKRTGLSIRGKEEIYEP